MAQGRSEDANTCCSFDGIAKPSNVSILESFRVKLTCRWVVEYDSATFASYINTLHRQFFLAQKIQNGPGKHVHDWFNAKAATLLVEGSQARVSKRKLTMDNSPEPEHPSENGEDPANGGVDIEDDSRQFEDDEEALRDVTMEGDDRDDEIMEVFATQTQTVRQESRDQEDANGDPNSDDEEDELRDVAEAPPPPVFRPMNFDIETYLSTSVNKRIRKGHEAVLEEQPKWGLLAKVLKEVEDTIARVSESHAGKLADPREVRTAESRCTGNQYRAHHVCL